MDARRWSCIVAAYSTRQKGTDVMSGKEGSRGSEIKESSNGSWFKLLKIGVRWRDYPTRWEQLIKKVQTGDFIVGILTGADSLKTLWWTVGQIKRKNPHVFQTPTQNLFNIWLCLDGGQAELYRYHQMGEENTNTLFLLDTEGWKKRSA